MRRLTTPRPAPRLRRSLVAGCVASVAFLPTQASLGQPAQAPGTAPPPPAIREQTPAPIDPQSVTCNDLKAQLKAGGGQLNILYGPRGWSDTFYGPAAPRCQFWQMPQFNYVRTRDGLCGIGYICVDKLSRD